MVDGLRLPLEDPRRQLIGVWEQVEGPNTPDVAHGGYTQTVLAIRTDGVLEIVRYYGRESKVRLDTRLSYKASQDGVLTIQPDTRRTGSDLAPKPIRIPIDGTELIAAAPKGDWPQTLKFKAEADKMILGDKIYRRKPSVPQATPDGPAPAR